MSCDGEAYMYQVLEIVLLTGYFYNDHRDLQGSHWRRHLDRRGYFKIKWKCRGQRWALAMPIRLNEGGVAGPYICSCPRVSVGSISKAIGDNASRALV